MVNVTFTEYEAETVLLALECFRRYHMDQYDPEDREKINKDISSAIDKLR